ncbi:T9SS type A sorting domain-containing protein [Paludibacteraceae bacterium OttesenSCG-928-F17]|nr:T9SS type A sorting domain-containing protein [Paludibacteraceae bacterium OttesenSCG-928-F17]
MGRFDDIRVTENSNSASGIFTPPSLPALSATQSVDTDKGRHKVDISVDKSVNKEAFFYIYSGGVAQNYYYLFAGETKSSCDGPSLHWPSEDGYAEVLWEYHNSGYKYKIWKELWFDHLRVPTMISAESDNEGGIKLKWSIDSEETGSSGIYTSGFRIRYRIDDGAYKEISANGIPSYNANTYDYNYTYKIPESESAQGEKEYSFEICRSGCAVSEESWDYNWFYKSVTKKINTDYETPLDPCFDSSRKRIYFKVKQGLRPSNFSYSITAASIVSGDPVNVSQECFLVPANDVFYSLGHRYYFQSGVSDCASTRYSIQTKIGSVLQGTPETIDVIYKPEGKSSVSSFTASKGYYNDRVQLKWTIPVNENDFSAFKIYRYAANDTTSAGLSKTEIYNKTYNKEDTSLEFTNTNVSPGTFYRYQLVGVIRCDNKDSEMKQAEDYGYAQAFGSAQGKVTFSGTNVGVPNVDIVFENSNPDDNNAKNKAVDFVDADRSGYIFIPTPYAANGTGLLSVQMWAKLAEKKAAGEVHQLFEGVMRTENIESLQDTIPAVGSIIYYGRNKGKPIAWEVVARDKDKLTLLCKEMYGPRKYNEVEGTTNWASSSVRSWLNSGIKGVGYLGTYFSPDEQKAIAVTNLQNVSGGATNDQVFLLSNDEFEAYKFSPVELKNIPPIPASVADDNAVVWVTNTNDDGKGSLRKALDAVPAGGRIVVDPSLTGDTIKLSKALLAPSRSFNIQGNSIVLMASSSDGVCMRFPKDGSSGGVYFNRVNFTSAKAQNTESLFTINKNFNISFGACIFSNWSSSTPGVGLINYLDNTEAPYMLGCTFVNIHPEASTAIILVSDGATTNTFRFNLFCKIGNNCPLNNMFMTEYDYTIYDGVSCDNFMSGIRKEGLSLDETYYYSLDGKAYLAYGRKYLHEYYGARYSNVDFYGRSRYNMNIYLYAGVTGGAVSENPDAFQWLRDTGTDTKEVKVVRRRGVGDYTTGKGTEDLSKDYYFEDKDVVSEKVFVRPALNLDLSSVVFTLTQDSTFVVEAGGSTAVRVKEESKLQVYVDSDNKVNVDVFGSAVTFDTDSIISVGAYFHSTVAIARGGSADSYDVTLYIDGKPVGTKIIKNAAAYGNMKFNYANIGGKGKRHLYGYIDEVRIWNSILSADQVKQNYNRYIQGDEHGLQAYYRFNEPDGIKYNCYDQSKNSTYDTYNENHGSFIGNHSLTSAEGNVPSVGQLGLKAQTDESGNYNSGMILPYRSSGSNYKITPILGVHQFDPMDETRTISGSQPNVNAVNFVDNSNFKYYGRVVYEGGNFPVEGCSFFVDGVQQTNSENEAILSNEEGEFKLTIPVGTHTIKIYKLGHTFVKDTIRRNFQDDEAVYNVRFHDKTRVRVVGRVVGGKVEGNKPLGFGESENNVGPARVVLVANDDKKSRYSFFDKQKYPDGKDTVITHFDPSRKNSVEYNGSKITIHTDEATGEFYADVYPEVFSISNIYTEPSNAEDYLKEAGAMQWNLTDKVTAMAETQKYLTRTWNDTIILNPKYPDLIEVVERIDSIPYNDTLSYVHRVAPQMLVAELDENGKRKMLGDDNDIPYYGEPNFIYKKNESASPDSINLAYLSQDKTRAEYCFIDDDEPVIGYPVYSQNKLYRYQVSVQEKYQNWQTKAIQYVPVVGGEIRIKNDMVQNKTEQRFILDSLGIYTYESLVHSPNTASGLRNIEFTYPCISPAECPNLKIRAIVIGGESTGTNFTTQGPDKIFFVLRDPPGNKSYAYWESESSMEYTESYTINQDFSAGFMAMVQMGTSQHVLTLAGVGAMVGTQTDFEYTNDLGAGLYAKEAYNEEGKKVTKITTKKRVQTSEDPDYVGPDADVFVGASTNLLYGKSNLIQIAEKEKAADFEAQFFRDRTDKYHVGKNTGISIGQQFKTMFHYTQRTIRDVLIPEWKQLIDNLLKTAPPDVAQLKVPYYYSHYARDHEKFGQPNSDRTSNGNSYTIVYPSGWTADDKLAYNDSVKLFNKQITVWETTLGLNERAKVNAKKRKKLNYSFGDGVSIDYSVVKDTINMEMSSVGGGFTEKSRGDIGLEINETGVQLTVEQELNFLKMNSSEQSSGKSETIGFVLSTSSNDNKLTVDIYEGVELEEECEKNKVNPFVEECRYYNPDSISGGFIFITRGGQTSCPYEGEYATEYYEKGTILNTATMQNEVPILDVLTKKSVSGVPADGKAVYLIKLLNNSESRVDGWYQLRVESASNPDGAVVRLDGQVLTESGASIFVPYGGDGVVKTVTIERGPTKYIYNNINLVMASVCQYDNMDFLEDIFSAVQLSATFLQGCSEVTVEEPLDCWVMNTENETGNALNIKVTGFDRNFENLGWIDVQWKDSYSSTWNTIKRYYFSDKVKKGDATITAENKVLYDGSGQINCSWDMTSRLDGNYDIRAITACVDTTTYKPFIYTTTPAKTGVKDMVRPEPFGRPEPKDGVLDINDEIMIHFNEPIAAGRIGKDNIVVTGIRSEGQGPKYHPAAVHFNGTSVVNTQSDITLSAPFTVEAWIRPNVKYTDNEEHIIFSHGNQFHIGIDGNSIVVYANGSEMYSEDIPFIDPTPQWGHLAVSYAANGIVTAYYKYGEITKTFSRNMGVYNQTARMTIGNNVAGNAGINADIHNLRVWTKAKSEKEISDGMYMTYNGVEKNLKHYYRFTEAIGTIAYDLAGGLDGTLNGSTWMLNPGGKAVNITRDGYLELPGAKKGFTKETDFSIEMWFKGAAGQTNATLFSAGNGDGTDMGSGNEVFSSSDKLSIYFDTQGRLTIASNGHIYTSPSGDYLDDKWHHTAFTVNRLTGNAQLFVDGDMIMQVSAVDIGGMISDPFFIGQRGWYRGNQQMTPDFKLDNPFVGLIDEARIWNAALEAAYIKNYKNVRVDSTAIGLAAYYPFENYVVVDGSYEVGSTLADLSKKRLGNAQLMSGAAISDEYAPVKAEGPVINLGYKYTVNGDKILISLTEDRARVEKSLVTISVDEIQDLNGNKMESAVIWTAYIDQTQLRWGQKELLLEGKPKENIEQTVTISNTGGAPVNYTISNMPTWLTVTPASGRLEARSSASITIKASKSVNVGKYEQVLLLNGESVDQLTVKLNLKNEAPDWSVDPLAYENSASVIASLLIDNVYSTDTDDKLAVFVGDECRGVANVTYESLYGRYMVYMTVYSDNFANDNFVYRIWDASVSEIREATTSAELNWENNYSFGSVNAPIVFVASDSRLSDLAFGQGWTWFSLNTSTSDMSLNNVFGGLTTKAEVLKNNAAFSATNGRSWIGALNEVNNTSMFKIKMHEASVLQMAGTPVNPQETPITLLPNWNWIAYIPQGVLTVQQALAGLQPSEGDLIKDQGSFATYSNDRWMGSLQTMHPGRGYVYQSRASVNKQFNYPYVAAQQSAKVLRSSQVYAGVFTPVTPNTYSENMSIIAVVKNGNNIMNNVEVGAFVTGECRGAESSREEGLVFLTVAGESTQEVLTFKVYDTNTDVTMEASQTLPFAIDAVIGSIDTPYIINLGTTGIDDNENFNVSIFPNPVSIDLYINSPWEIIEQVEITDISGRFVYREVNFQDKSINVSHLAKGVYLLKLTNDGKNVVLKFTKK